MPSTAAVQHATTSRLIRGAITLLRERGIYTGSPGYVGDDDSLNIPAAILLAHTRQALPPAEFTRKACLAQWGDPDAHFRARQPVMDAIRFLSACIDGQPNNDMTTGEPDYIDHLAWWPTYRPIDAQTPPSLDDVLDVMAKAATLAADIARQGTHPANTDDWGLCLTCHGHGSVQGEEIPYDQLRPRQQQGYAHGRRYHQSRDCPTCDGQDRVTDAAISAHESAA